MLSELRKCLALIDRKTAQRAVVVAGLMLVAAMLEAFGLGLIYTFILALVEPSRVGAIPWIGGLVGPAFAANQADLLIFLTLSLLAVVLAKNVILLGFYYIQAGFLAVNEATLATRLLDSYLNGAYALHLTRNSAEFIRNVTDSVPVVFSPVIMGFINLVSELVVIAALAVVLLMLEPLLTVGAAAVLGVAVGIFFAFSKGRYQRWGRLEQGLQAQVLKSLQQGFHSIKEVKILGRQNFIRESFERPRRQLAGIRTKLATMAPAPRLWTESVIVVTVLSVVVLALSAGGTSAEILSALTLFAAAAFRMIPSMNRIIIALNGIKNGSYAVDLVHRDIRDFLENPDEGAEDDGRPLAFNDLLSLEKLSFSYGQGEGVVLNDVDLILRRGESLGLVGPSGAGKTTLVDIALGLLAPTSGAVRVDGVKIFDATRAWRRQIGYVPQSIYVIDDTLRRNIAFGLNDDEIDEAKVQNAVRLAQLEDLVRELPAGLNTTLGDRGIRLSGGQRQRVGIARALYRDPEVLIFDEATAYLDNETEHEINDAVQRLRGRKTLIIIAHRLSTVRRCDRLVFLENGRISDTGSFEELTARNASFRNLVELAKL